MYVPIYITIFFFASIPVVILHEPLFLLYIVVKEVPFLDAADCTSDLPLSSSS